MNQRNDRSRENAGVAQGRVGVVPGLNLAFAQHSEIVAAVVAYANREQLSVGDGRDTVPLFMSGRDLGEPDGYAGLEEDIVHYRQSERDFAVQMLQAAATGSVALNDFIVQAIRLGRRSLARVGGQLTLIDGVPALESFDVRGNPDEWVLHAAVTLASSAGGKQTDVGRCQLKACSKFFVIKRGKRGAPPRRYCCDTHRDAQHNAGAADRQRRSRERRRERSRAKARRRR